MRRAAFVGAAGILSLVLFPPALWADSGCKRMKGTIDLQFVGQWVGRGEVSIGGVSSSFVVAFETQSIKETDDGNFVGTEIGTFDFGSGNIFSELDRFTFGPSEDNPDLFHFNGVGRIIEGMGVFRNAYGRLVIQGFATFQGAVPEFSGTLKGRICGVE